MKMQMRSTAFILKSLVLGIALTGFQAYSAEALPFNTDMYHPQPMTGEVMRPKAPNSVPMGSSERRLEGREEALNLKNPLKGDRISIANGDRLFAINCAPCHGTYNSEGVQTPSWFAAQVFAPDLTNSMYWDTSTGRSDGNIYGTIHLGSPSTLMPAYGWKLSPTEHWDIINYLRSFQEAKGKATSK